MLTREGRMNLAQHRTARRREQTALLAHARARLRDNWSVLDGVQPQRVVLAHRSPWFRGRTAQELSAVGVEIVEVDDGAAAVGVVLAEQPDLVFVEDRLSSYPGREVLRQLRAEAPAVHVAVQLSDSRDLQGFLALGACAAFSRRIAPADVAAQLRHCLTARQEPLVRL